MEVVEERGGIESSKGSDPADELDEENDHGNGDPLKQVTYSSPHTTYEGK
jgi:hypothetical protein